MLKGLSRDHLEKKKEFSQKTPLCTKWFFKTKRKSISFKKKKKNHGHVHFENTIQGLDRSHDHILSGLDVFLTDLNYVQPGLLEERCVGNLLKRSVNNKHQIKKMTKVVCK